MQQRKRVPTALFAVFIVLAGAIGAGVFAWWIPMRIERRCEKNERHALTTLRSLASAEATFYAEDRDQNGVKDFWTGDVAGLHKYGLIPRVVAEADAFPIVPLVPQPVPRQGYFYAALEFDDSVTPSEAYRQETDQTSGKVHHRSKIGFVAWPADWGKTGRWVYWINEDTIPYGTREPFDGRLHWPTEAEFQKRWVDLDQTPDPRSR